MPNPGSPEATIEVDGLRKRFGPTLALDGMTFSVLPGQVTGFVGPNGAGQGAGGCHDSQRSRAPPAPVAAGQAVHRGLLKEPGVVIAFSSKPGLVIVSCCTEGEVTAR